jgi:tripartite-type tricarboxylate transporter receptor subunit TctC
MRAKGHGIAVARALIAIALAAIAVVAAGQSYPMKPIRFVAPFPPSGGTDATARIVAQALAEQMGQQVIVDNRGGAGGRIGMELVAKAPADGYTMVLGNVGPLAILPASGVQLRVDPVRDFQAVSLLAMADYILTVHPSLPVRTVKDLIALARANPGALTFASSGNITGPHLAGELLNALGNVKLVHVAYKGNAQGALALMSGEVAVMFGRGAVVAHIASGKLRGIATTARKRTTPPLPTMAETLPGFEITQWYGVLVPAGTPREIVARLNKEIAVAMAKPAIAQAYRNLGTEPGASSPEEFAALMRSETAHYAKLMKMANIKAD